MAKERIINTKFWDDGYIAKLDPVEKLLYLYFLTNPLTNICGVYEIQLRRIAFDTGIDKDMVQKILDRFERDNKVYFIDGWLAIKNFIKHQKDNPKIKKGIEIGLESIPKKILDRLYIDYDRLSHSNSNSNSNLNSNSNIVAKSDAPEVKEEKKELPFIFKEEIKKLEDSSRRDLNIIALYFEYRKPDFENRKQYELALRRHLKPAGQLKDFTDKQIIKAIEYAHKEYKDVYTLETLIKILTK